MASIGGGQQPNKEEKLLLSLHKERSWSSPYVYLFQEFWCLSTVILVTSLPKSGTTWLKSLIFTIVNQQYFSPTHYLLPIPMTFTHLPFTSLPDSIIESICRNPFDTFVSSWTFFSCIKQSSLPALTLEEAFEMYCNGIIGFGSRWSHIPNKVLFLEYEDHKEDVNLQVKRIIEFLGCPFTHEEENNGVIESIIKLCSFENTKDLEVNKSGKLGNIIENKSFFRKAVIGNWMNYFSPSMIEKLSKIVEEKLSGSGLSFKMYS
ncbi:hypothetical protein GYH30_043297 [Glycine max]|nr:hypothetical protein GYH30_043297 [Glycine max]